MNTVADEITENIILNTTDASIAHALRTTVDNDVCVQIYNSDGEQVYAADSLGSGCLLNTPGFHSDEVIGSLNETQKEASYFQTNQSTNQEMIVFSRLVHASLSNYYMIVNAPLEPVDSVVSFFSQQYLFYTLIAIIVASFVALFC